MIWHVLDDIIRELRSVVARVENLDLWPPWEIIQDVADAVGDLITIATEPPRPDPADLDDARAGWRQIDTHVSTAVTDLETVPGAVDTPVWEGDDGDAFRESVRAADLRLSSVETATGKILTALALLSNDMTDARTRHGNAFDGLGQHLTIDLSDLNPFSALNKLRGIVGEVIEGGKELTGAYEDARDALTTCATSIDKAMDDIDLPTEVPDTGGLSAIDLVNAWDEDEGPLRGSVLSRYDEHFGELTPAQQREVREALAAAGDDDLEKAWIVAAIASGMDGDTLTNYMDHLSTMTPSQLEDLDPMGQRGDQVVQPNGTTCGSSSLVMSRMLNNPAYAMYMATGYDPETGKSDGLGTGTSAYEQRFADEAEAMQDRTNARHDRNGDPQWPYPHAIGTAPWATAREMSVDDGSGVPGTEYESNTVDPHNRSRAYDDIAQASRDGHTVPLYIGNSYAPGHVVLVTGESGDSIEIYEPSSGETQTITRQQFEDGDLPFGPMASPGTILGDMDEAWFYVAPK